MVRRLRLREKDTPILFRGGRGIFLFSLLFLSFEPNRSPEGLTN